MEPLAPIGVPDVVILRVVGAVADAALGATDVRRTPVIGVPSALVDMLLIDYLLMRAGRCLLFQCTDAAASCDGRCTDE